MTLDYIVNKYNIDINLPSPIWLKFDRNIDLPQLFKELDFKKGAEIGVLYGTYSEILCKALPDTDIYSVDPWKWYPLYNNFRRASSYEPIYQSAKELLAQYKNNTIIRKASLEAAEDFKDESLDFVFIDADHRFRNFTDDLDVWSRKVRKGGIVSGHDFGRSYSKEFVHVRFVVPAWCLAYDIKPWFILDAPQQRSWMYVK